MAKLKDYKTKRNFNETPEPKPKLSNRQASESIFVIQKHSASHLHYDLRLELNGVLKSWAIPKGPSLNPADKRLAIMVEDHPFDYRNFEGIIPKGNYGAGAVIIWDEGVYSAIGAKDKKESEKMISKGLEKGHLKLAFYGNKIKGEFALIKTHTSDKEDRAWLFIKKSDEFSSEDDVTSLNRSIRTKRSIEDVFSSET